MSAHLIAIEGIDGSGKGTVSSATGARLKEAGLKAEVISFPRYSGTFFGKEIGLYLDGQYGSPAAMNPRLVSILYAGDRFESRSVIQDAARDSDVLIFDRYAPSNWAHLGARLPAGELEDFIAWSKRLETDVFGIPRPDAVVYLDIPVAVAAENVLRKARRDYTDQAQDEHERDQAYLARVRDCYDRICSTQDDWHRISVMAQDQLRSPEALAEEILQRTLPRHLSGLVYA